MSRSSRRTFFPLKSLHFVSANQLGLLQNGAMFFPALETAIREAQVEIFLETYIFKNDVIGMRIAAALEEAAAREVKVRLMVDAFGSSATPAHFFDGMRAAGVAIHLYRPKRGWLHFKRHRLRRLHRKLACIDGTLAFVGGINIQDDLDVPGVIQPRFDHAAQIQGTLVLAVREQMARLWNLLEWAGQQSRPQLLAPPVVPLPAGRQRAALVIRDNLFHRRDIERIYLSAIGHAREEIIIANAYFLPGRRLRRALTEAARRGVSVKLLLQGRMEHFLEHHASHALYGQLLGAGVAIFQYQVANLHAKAAVIDGHWATVGSSNLEPFSLILSREANVVVEDKVFAGELRASLQTAMANQSIKTELKFWTGRTLLQRTRDWLAYGVVRLLAAAASPRDKLY
jgi:cardiolipin synthase